MSEHAVEGWVMDHPYRGAVWEPDVLRWEARTLREPANGELLIRPIYLSLDPSNLVWAQLERTYIGPAGDRRSDGRDGPGRGGGVAGGRLRAG
jgi:NADPH-dependent curcumin reductase CurA